MTRKHLDYQWRLRQMMAAHEMWKTTQLAPLLRERGVELSSAQIYRLVAEKPERLSMKVLVALCDIFDCTPNELIAPEVVTAHTRKAANGAVADVAELKTDLRPERAQITDQ